MNASNSTNSLVFIRHYSDIMKPSASITVVGRQDDVRSNRQEGADNAIDDPNACYGLQSFQRPAEATGGPSRQDDAQRRARSQILSPRRSAAASRSTVSARSIMGGCMPSVWRSLMYRAQAWQTRSS